MTTAEISGLIDGLSLQLTKRKQVLDGLSKESIELHNELDILNESENLLIEAIQLVGEAKEAMENFVSRGLQLVYSDDISFIIEEVTSGYQLLIKKGDTLRPLLSEGKGYRSTVSFLMLFLTIALTSKNKIIIADEPLPVIDEKARANLCSFLETFCEEENFQLIMNTHWPDPIGKVYSVTQKNGESHAKPIT
jgi:wobble nucleotide-excising tRNase